MRLLISFSGREMGNCDQIADYVAREDDKIVYFRDLNARACGNCDYECFTDACKYRGDDVYGLYESMLQYEQVVLLVPMYCGNPASMYFVFNERSQDFFMHNEMQYEKIAQRLYIVGVYGDAGKVPDFQPAFEKWFEETPYTGRVLGIERHRNGMHLKQSLIEMREIRDKISAFLA